MALPGWKRSAWRLGVTLPTLAQPVGIVLAPEVTLLTDGALTLAGLAYGSVKTTQAVQTWQHVRTWVRPLHSVLAPVLGIGDRARPDSYLSIPLDFQTDPDTQITVQIPTSWEGDQTSRQRVQDIIRTRLALQDVDMTWHLSGPRPTLTIRQAPKPPAAISWADALPLMRDAAESAPLIGIGQRGKLVAVDLDSDSPHILLSMSTGGGKSVFARAIAAQILARGGRVIICDIKRVSHRWARSLPGVTYARSPEEIHDAIIMVAEEGARRFEMIEEDRDEEVAALPRVLLIMEEMNACMGKLTRYWNAIREKDDPKKSPAIEAFGDTLFMGRQARTHVLAIGQLMTARAMGGPEMRECFSTRVLARYSQNAWKMLVPEVWPAPKASRHAGRVQLVQAGTAYETQVIFGSEEEARELVLSSRPRAVPTSHETDHQRNGPETVPGTRAGATPGLRLVKSAPNNPIPVDPNAPIGLRNACKSGLISLSDTADKTLAILRAARTRDPEFPLPVRESGKEKLYLPSELVKWARNRPSATG